MKYACDRSFALSESNQRKIAIHGWDPLIYVFFDNVEIQRVESEGNTNILAPRDLHDEIATEELIEMGLNLRSRYAGWFVMQLL